MKKLYLILPFLLFFMGTIAQTPDLKKDKVREIKEKIKRQIKDQHPKPQNKTFTTNQPTAKQTEDWEYGNPPAWVWSQDAGASGWDNINDVVTDNNGNYYFTGAFSGKISYGDTSFTASGLRDAFVAKFDGSHNLLWFNQIKASSQKRVNLEELHLDGNGEIHSTGYFAGNITPGGVALSGDARQNYLYLKLTADGEISVAKTYDTGHKYSSGKALETDQDNNAYVLTSNYIFKYNQSGDLIWNIYEDEILNDVELIENSLYFTGYIHTYSGRIGEVSYSMDGSQIYDFFLAKSDLNGNFSYVKLPNHTEDGSDTRGLSIETDKNKNLYVTGYFEEDIVLGEDTLGANYTRRSILSKFDTTGKVHWTKLLNLTAGFPFPVATTKDSITYVSVNDNIFKYNENGSWVDADYSIGYNPNALYMNENTGNLVTVGNKDGALYYSELNSSLGEELLKEFNSTSASVSIAGMVSDDKGNIFVYGDSENSIVYHGDSISEGVFYAKHNSKGDMLWVKNIQNADTYKTIGSSIVLDPQSQYFTIVGSFAEEINVPGGGTLTPDDDGGIFILQYDVSGNLVWSKRINDLEFDSGVYNESDLTADYSGNVILANTFTDTARIGSQEFYPPTTGHNDYDVLIIKFNSSGDIQWIKQAGGESVEYMGITSVDQNDTIYFTGEFVSQNVSFGDSSLTLNNGDGNILFSKLSPQGKIQWIKTHAGVNGSSSLSYDAYCWPTGIKTLPNGYSYIKGAYGDSTSFSDTLLVNDYESYNCFVGKFNPNGEAVWVRSIDQEYYGFDYNQMDVDNNGNVYMGTRVTDTIHFKYFNNEYTYQPVGENDLFVAQYTPDGRIGWIKTMASRYGYNRLGAVAATGPKEVFVAGDYDDYISIGSDEYYSDGQRSYVANIGEIPNQAPFDITLSSDSILEGKPAGTKVGIFSTDDPDVGDSHKYSLVSGDGTNDADNPDFNINKDTLVSATKFDYDNQQQLNIFVQTKDTAGHTYAEGFEINVKEKSQGEDETVINEIQNSPFTIYPNPVSDNLVVRNGEECGEAVKSIRIITMEGRTVYTKKPVSARKHKINLSGIPEGMYIIELNTGNKNYKGKLIKE